MRRRGRALLAWAGALALGALPCLSLGASESAGAPGAKTAPAAASPGAAQVQSDFFEARIRPILAQRCYACHSGKVTQGGLRLDEGKAALRGGESGPSIVPGKPDESRLIQAVRYKDPHLRMPPAGKLPAAELELLAEWVRRGAVFPAARSTGPAKQRAMTVQDGKRFWAFRPLACSPPPKVKRRDWPVTPIDTYLLAKLEAAGLEPAPRADPRTLIRRAYFDLIGLPPAPEDVEAFVRECEEWRRKGIQVSRSSGIGSGTPGSPVRASATPRLPNTRIPEYLNTQGALRGHPPEYPNTPSPYEALIDRLLASPQYGERWARHWLDLVRYCDVPESWAQVDAQPWLYRDWVVRALNEDMPYDEFVKRQLAADEMPALPPTEMAALGMLGLSPSYWKELKLAPDVIKTVVAEEWEERVNTVTSTVLGLTVACARCHDHKFDPVTQKDYYALAGIFANTRLTPRPLVAAEAGRQIMAARDEYRELGTEAQKLKDEAAKMAAKDAAKAEELKQKAETTLARAEEIRKATPDFDAPRCYAVEAASLDVLPDGPDRTRLEYHPGMAQNVALQLRGNPAKTGPVVPRGFLALFSAGEPRRFTQGSGRRELGEALFRDAAPLTARVIVNRVWRHHFGRGLVETPSNFGTQGDRPSHPELLEFLAHWFVHGDNGVGADLSGGMGEWGNGRGNVQSISRSPALPLSPSASAKGSWSLKRLHRLIMLSAAYQQSSAPAPTPHSKLRTSHSVDPENRLVGRMSRRRLEVEAWRDTLLAASGTLDLRVGGQPAELSAKENRRRTLYGVVKRRELDDLLRLYDFPDPTGHSPARFATTTPLQGLFVLNAELIGRQATALGARLKAEVPDDLRGQLRRAYLLLYSRPASEREIATGLQYLGAADGKEPSVERWQQYLEVLLARNELMFID